METSQDQASPENKMGVDTSGKDLINLGGMGSVFIMLLTGDGEWSLWIGHLSPSVTLGISIGWFVVFAVLGFTADWATERKKRCRSESK